MIDHFLQQAGLFVYPLGACCVAVGFVIIERLLGLQKKKIIPNGFLDHMLRGQAPGAHEKKTIAGRIYDFFYQYQPDGEALKAYAQLEVSRMERGFFLLEIVITGAPILGLLGTVMGLIQVFGQFTGSLMDDPSTFVGGIALALTTTMLGLITALPAIIGHSYLTRRVDLLAAELNIEVERLLQIQATQIIGSAPVPPVS